MTMPHHNGRSLVDLANDQTLLIYTIFVGHDGGPPRWVQCTANGTDTRPSSRITLVRESGEDCSALWVRVLRAIRELKSTRGFQHHVHVNCRTDNPPISAEQSDNRFNIIRALWHEVEHERDAVRRVAALCTLADIVHHPGLLPSFR